MIKKKHEIDIVSCFNDIFVRYDTPFTEHVNLTTMLCNNFDPGIY